MVSRIHFQLDHPSALFCDDNDTAHRRGRRTPVSCRSSRPQNMKSETEIIVRSTHLAGCRHFLPPNRPRFWFSVCLRSIDVDGSQHTMQICCLTGTVLVCLRSIDGRGPNTRCKSVVSSHRPFVAHDVGLLELPSGHQSHSCDICLWACEVGVLGRHFGHCDVDLVWCCDAGLLGLQQHRHRACDICLFCIVTSAFGERVEDSAEDMDAFQTLNFSPVGSSQLTL